MGTNCIERVLKLHSLRFIRQWIFLFGRSQRNFICKNMEDWNTQQFSIDILYYSSIKRYVISEKSTIKTTPIHVFWLLYSCISYSLLHMYTGIFVFFFISNVARIERQKLEIKTCLCESIELWYWSCFNEAFLVNLFVWKTCWNYIEIIRSCGEVNVKKIVRKMSTSWKFNYVCKICIH